MKIKKYFGLILFCIAFNAQAFDLVKLDEAVLGFLNEEFAHKCTDIGYSYHYALRVHRAYEKGFYEKDWKPSDFDPPVLPTDIYVKFETNKCDLLETQTHIKGYSMTLRKDSSGRYKIIGFHKYSPEI